jgi:hypothetical protein
LAVYKESGSTFFSNLTTATKLIEIDACLFDNVMQALSNLNTERVKLELIGEMKD